MTKDKRILAKAEIRRQKMEKLAQTSPEEIEESILPTVTDVYSHQNFSRRRRRDLGDGGGGKHE